AGGGVLPEPFSESEGTPTDGASDPRRATARSGPAAHPLSDAAAAPREAAGVESAGAGTGAGAERTDRKLAGTEPADAAADPGGVWAPPRDPARFGTGRGGREVGADAEPDAGRRG